MKFARQTKQSYAIIYRTTRRGENMEKLAIVTGATGGLGGEFCKDLARRGYSLIITGTKQERVDSFKNELEKEFAVFEISPVVWRNFPPAVVYRCIK